MHVSVYRCLYTFSKCVPFVYFVGHLDLNMCILFSCNKCVRKVVTSAHADCNLHHFLTLLAAGGRQHVSISIQTH